MSLAQKKQVTKDNKIIVTRVLQSHSCLAYTATQHTNFHYMISFPKSLHDGECDCKNFFQVLSERTYEHTREIQEHKKSTSCTQRSKQWCTTSHSTLIAKTIMDFMQILLFLWGMWDILQTNNLQSTMWHTPYHHIRLGRNVNCVKAVPVTIYLPRRIRKWKWTTLLYKSLTANTQIINNT
jgi:hypothetical protein